MPQEAPMNLQPLEDRIVVRPARPRRRPSAASSSPTPPRRSPSRAKSSRWARAVAPSRPASSSRSTSPSATSCSTRSTAAPRSRVDGEDLLDPLEPRRPRQGRRRQRQEEVALTTRDPGARGGRQRIPRPVTARAGAAAPWASLASGPGPITLDRVRERFAGYVPPPRPPLAPGGRAAAVLLPLFEEHGEVRLVLTRRPETMPSHQRRDRLPGRQGGSGGRPRRRATPRCARRRRRSASAASWST